MARIVICCAAADEPLADALAAVLDHDGHEVRILARPDPGSLKAGASYEALIAVWSDSSVASERLRSLAAEALRSGRLLPVRTALLDVGRIPQAFRALATPLLDDIPAIRRMIGEIVLPPAAVEAPELQSVPLEEPLPEPRPGALGGAHRFRAYAGRSAGADVEESWTHEATARTPPPASAAPALDVAGGVHLEQGTLVHRIPEKMWLGEPETVEVRLGREGAEGLISGLVGRGALKEEALPILETMSVTLVALDGGFDIVQLSETVQLVVKDSLKGTGLEGESFGRWLWRVTPRRKGRRRLCVKVSASLTDSRGVPSSASLPDREFAVTVEVRSARTALRILGRLILAASSAAAAGLIGAATQELWWPELKALLASWGVLAP